ncbi:MAG: hypothetical protein Ta2D_00300 [Rickettsiales bacterium]|nr:MAG: hypothetical protein Ta2D_00300 [Rickettsiales bacterium]
MNDLKEKLKNLDYKFLTTTILLVLLLGIELCREVKFRTFSHKVRQVQGRVLRDKTANVNETFEINGFTFTEKSRVRKGEYLLKIEVPKELKEEDVKFNVNDKLLDVSFEVNVDNNLIQFQRAYTLPVNDIKKEDIKLKLKKGKLSLDVPFEKQR